MPVTPVEFGLASLALIAGGILQSVTGMGAGIMVVPLLALIRLDFVPGPQLVAGMWFSFLISWRGRRQIRTAGLWPLMLGLLGGCILGGALVSIIPRSRAGAVAAVIVLIAVVLTTTSRRIELSNRNLTAGGIVSGIMGTLCGIGAPPLALMYQHEAGPTLRPTLAFLYATSSVMILAMLALAGRFGPTDALVGCLFVPGYLVGGLIARPLLRHMDQARSRAAILWISTGSAVVLLIRSLS